LHRLIISHTSAIGNCDFRYKSLKDVQKSIGEHWFHGEIKR
jgi:hypothetical protein